MSGQPFLKLTATRMQLPDGQIPHAGKTLDAAEANALATFLRLVRDDDCKRLTEDHQQAHLLAEAFRKLRGSLEESDRTPPITSGLLSLINPDAVKAAVDRTHTSWEGWVKQPRTESATSPDYLEEDQRLRREFTTEAESLFLLMDGLVYPYGRPTEQATPE
jgi:hypothetical protein